MVRKNPETLEEALKIIAEQNRIFLEQNRIFQQFQIREAELQSKIRILEE